MTPPTHNRTWAVLLITALAALLGLGTLQYHWVSQISAGERERMQATLQVSAARFQDDFDRELARIYLSFQIDSSAVADHSWTRYAERYERWRTTAPYPELVRDVYLVEVKQPGQVRLRRFDASSGRFLYASWSEQLHGLRAQFERAYHATLSPEAILDAPPLNPLADELPAMIIPAARQWILSDQQARAAAINADLLFAQQSAPSLKGCGPCSTPVSSNTLVAYTLVTLDDAYLRQQFIPMLAQQHLSVGDELRYDLAITRRAVPEQIVYRTGGAPTTGDATFDLFSLRYDQLNRLLIANDPREDEPDDANRSEQNIAIGIMGNAADEQATSGAWQVTLTHRAGSLDAAVQVLQRRNLLISFGTLLVLALALGLLFMLMQRSQRLAAQKLAFAASISHELRTPLTVIRSASENLADGVVHDMPQVQRYGALIRSESRRLADMVEQALEFAGVQSGRKSYDLHPLDTNELIERTLAQTQPLLYEHDITLDHTVAPDLPPVLGDAAALRQALHNLLVNAVKYGGPARWIGIEALRVAGRQGAEVRIRVRDRGIGIAAADLAHVWEPFFRGRAATAAQIHGSGLGLSLVQHIIAAHGGRVEVQSAPGQGSSFTIHLPAAPSEVADAITDASTTPAYSAHRG